ncbi:hypothetical protein BDW74DRAFT_166737 [Aspergillus multicolor]|uniref:putative ubiquitin conjugating enzyme n=1 Tax=Aspergillus multicolor TaxID=41759 RepID=UPI003CCDE6F0
MPRKDFQKELQEACRLNAFPQLTDVRSGSEDGAFYFTYTSPDGSHSLKLEVTVPDTSDYPREHHYFVFTVSDNITEAVPRILEDSLDTFHGLPVHDFLEAVTACLDKATSTEDDSSDFPEDSDSDPGTLADNMDWEESSNTGLEASPSAKAIDIKKCIRSDLRKARSAGFRVGILGDPEGAVILSASRRISRLGISAEAMEAWGVRPSQYFVLLIRYAYGYRTLADVVHRSAAPVLVRFHAGVCDEYKPSLNSAVHVFATGAGPGAVGPDQDINTDGMEPVLNSIFIGKSLQSLLNSRFIDLIRYRLEKGFTWTGAELYMNDGQGRLQAANDTTSDSKYFEPEVWRGSPPSFLQEDHLANAEDPLDISLLLVAMQFTLRRFVRCTEFCLNCYCRIDAGFEALKPFVCSNGLCLYQYMSLGMGPSLEWEITSQPYVVDLLISFAYHRAASYKLNDFPTGFPLKVPDPNRSALPNPAIRKGKLTYDINLGPTIHMDSNYDIKIGDWIIILLDPPAANFITQPSTQPTSQPPFSTRTRNELHARVKDISAQPIIFLSELIPRWASQSQSKPKEPYKGDVQFVVYDSDFSALNERQKSDTALDLLDTLPSRGGQPRPLSEWQDRIHPSALYILQWIVGSNRSVIMYDDNPQNQIPGMESFIQFRFAQGAPDKEQRFVTAVNKTAARLGSKYPTLFAWHGSPLHNWHSILREGLHYKEIVNGRSCGNGIYMAPQFQTSIGYCNRHFVYDFSSSVFWPHSELNVSKAIALNEVVNAPAEFVCHTSCYVVQHVDWVQTRYLFVDLGSTATARHLLRSKNEPPANVYAQDPTRLAFDEKGNALSIPISATNSHRSKDAIFPLSSERPKPKPVRRGKRKLSDIQMRDDDDAASVETLPEDRSLLLSDDEDNGRGQRPRIDVSVTPFQPGTLDVKTIKLLGEPSYATPRATRTLQKVLRQALQMQEEQPLQELGWYINGNLIDNVYQWIVELHSFDKNLAIAKDLEKAKVNSIVIEMRFPASYPLTPPFLRIIRPRFVRFAHGGGGHITAGGAMCMELLTNTGWLPSFSIESVLLQVKLAITNELPRPARLDLHARPAEYGIGEAISEYKRVCIAHGWEVPKDLDQIRW